MPTSITKTQRWLDLIAYLVGRHRPVAAAELMERLPAYAGYGNAASAARVFERDKEELRTLGFPLETARYRTSFGQVEELGYTLASGDFYLPYLKLVEGMQTPRLEKHTAEPSRLSLSPADAAEVLDALHAVAERPEAPLAAEARTAYAKLGFGVDAAALAPTPLLYAEPADAAARARALDVLTDALLARQRVRFHYHAIGRDEWSERDVAPYGLLASGGNWYLVGHDAARGAQREFHLGRMQEVSPAGEPGAYRVPAGFRLQALAHRPAWELGDDEPLPAEVRFRFPASLWAERNGHGERVRQEDEGVEVRRFQVRQPGPFLRWLLGLEVEAELLSPAGLLADYRALVQRTLTQYHQPGRTRAQD